MKCIYCGNDRTEVVETRESNNGTVTRRRRECSVCSRRFTTYEKAEKYDLVVVKKSGATEDFDKEKIRESLFKACKGQDITDLTILKLTDQIEQDLLLGKKPQIETKDIARLILRKLHDLDEVAFIRFASYQFHVDSIGDLEELKEKAMKEIF